MTIQKIAALLIVGPSPLAPVMPAILLAVAVIMLIVVGAMLIVKRVACSLKGAQATMYAILADKPSPSRTPSILDTLFDSPVNMRR